MGFAAVALSVQVATVPSGQDGEGEGAAATVVSAVLVPQLNIPSVQAAFPEEHAGTELLQKAILGVPTEQVIPPLAHEGVPLLGAPLPQMGIPLGPQVGVGAGPVPVAPAQVGGDDVTALPPL